MQGGKEMEININNYEVFIIDYLDNKLDALQTAELLLFLENNPALKDDIEGLKEITVEPPEKEVFGFKELLVQPPDQDAANLSIENYSHYFIADLENDLSLKGKSELKKFLAENQELAAEYNLFAACRLSPDKKVTFPHPEKLKVRTKSVFIRYYLTTGIAASMLLLATIYFRLTPETEDSVNQTLRNTIEFQMNETKEPAADKDKEVKEPADTKPENENKATKPASTKTKTIRNVPASNTKKTIEAPVRKLERKGMIINTTSLVAENSTRNFYSGLYEDIRLSQELALAAQEEKEQETEEIIRNEKIRGVKTSRIINSVISTGEQIAEQVPESMNGWLIADLGIKGFNFLTNNDYSINRRINSKGSIEEIRIEKENKL